jgi:hypothetical protein
MCSIVLVSVNASQRTPPISVRHDSRITVACHYPSAAGNLASPLGSSRKDGISCEQDSASEQPTRQEGDPRLAFSRSKICVRSLA